MAGSFRGQCLAVKFTFFCADWNEARPSGISTNGCLSTYECRSPDSNSDCVFYLFVGHQYQIPTSAGT